MKKFAIQSILLLVVIFGALYFTSNKSAFNAFMPTTNQSATTKQIKIGNSIINVEVADNSALRSKGLSGRQSLSQDQGMLFIYPDSSKHQFWMKGMNFPLDFIFIREGKIVDLLENIPPPSSPNQPDEELLIYEPSAPIDMMLEVNAGFVKTNNLQVGDTVFLIK